MLGTPDSPPLVRPSSSARPLVWVSENFGSPVAHQSIAVQITGGAPVRTAY